MALPAPAAEPPATRRHLLAAGYTADASVYDELWSPAILPSAESLVRSLRIEHARLVLDVGAGTGSLTPALRAAAPQAIIVGIDASEGMLQIARTRRQARGVVGDAAALPVTEHTADAVVLAFVLFHLPDPDAGLAEAARALRPPGHLGTVTWAKEWPTRAGTLWDEALDAAGAPAPPARSDHGGLDSPAAMDDKLRRAGLVPRRVWTRSIDYTFAPKDFWQLRVGFGSPRWRLERVDPSSREDVLARLRDRFSKLGTKDFRFRGRVVLAIAEGQG